MKSTKARKSAAAKNGRAKRGIVSKTLRYVGDHPKAATAGVLAAGIGAYALLRGGKGKKKASAAAAKPRRAASRGRSSTN
jgi:hypothetical protein